MPKKNRVQFSRMVDDWTFKQVQSLASQLGCSQGEVIDRAVRLLSTGAESTPHVVSHNGALEELKHQVAKVLAGIEHLLELEGMMEAVVRHVVEAPTRGSAVERSFEEGGVFAPYSTATGAVIHADQQVMARPSFQSVRTQACRHCGGTFGGPRTATICSECKSTGHTNEPGECPRCTEGKQI